ncbi:MAG: galactokinase [Clostridia bacterium]|nr:galactokinase [Clostridia bacterium]
MFDKTKALELFEKLYGAGEVRVFFAPGRVNLIGEHIDYNGGYVFPAALELGNYVLVRERADDIVNLAADDLPGTLASCSLSSLESKRGREWGAYQFGVLDELKKLGISLRGMDMLFSSTLPFGAGLSSSASIEVVTAFAALKIAGAELSMTEVALLTQRAENKFVGVNCGIMDQFACANGRAGHGMLLDCATVVCEQIPLNLEGYTIVVGNTNKKRGLADSKYNERRAECERGLEMIRARCTELKDLCSLTEDDLAEYEDLLTDETVKRRVTHVVSENARVIESVILLKKGDIEGFGKLLNASHLSLRDLYEVTGNELDTMTEIARAYPGCVGSRMTGAGFGGCTVSIVEDSAVEGFIAYVSAEYEKRTGLRGDLYASNASDGPVELF